MKANACFAMFFISLLFSGNIAIAETAEEMLSACRDVSKAEIINKEEASFRQDFHTGMCWGAFAVLQEISRHVKENKRIYHVCTPPKSTRTQLISVFVNYAEKNPQRLHEDFFHVAMDSLREAFKCKK